MGGGSQADFRQADTTGFGLRLGLGRVSASAPPSAVIVSAAMRGGERMNGCFGFYKSNDFRCTGRGGFLLIGFLAKPRRL